MVKVFGISLPPLFRASPNSPSTSLSNPSSWLTALFAPKAKSGAEVSNDNVISLSAVWRAVSLISQSVAILPFEVIEENEDGSIRVAKDHPIYYTLRQEPNELYSTFNFLRSLVAQACFFGNGYAIIHRNETTSRPERFTLIDQSTQQVDIFINPENGRLFYKIQDVESPVPAPNVIHINNLGFNGIAGRDVIATHRENYGLAIAARDFGNTFFNKGSFLSGYISVPQTLNQEAYNRIKSSWNGAYAGAQNAGKTAVLEQGAEFKPLNMKPADASMLETQKFSTEDVARIFGVPPHLLYALDRATFNNIEHLGKEFDEYTRVPWVEQIEQEFSRKVFPERERTPTRNRNTVFKARLDISAIGRADSEAKAKYYQSGIQNGWLRPNEARMKEGFNPVAGGDKNFIQLNMTTLEKAGEQEDISQPNTDDDAVE